VKTKRSEKLQQRNRGKRRFQSIKIEKGEKTERRRRL
jgi:hypothetical protein